MGFPYLGFSFSMNWHALLPNNTNHNLSAYQQHLPLLSIKKKSNLRLQIKHKHLPMHPELKTFPDSDIKGRLIYTPLYTDRGNAGMIGCSAFVPK